MCIAAGIGAAAVGSLAGGIIAGQGAKSAASTQAGAAENAQAISEREFNTITQQEQPYMQAGYGAQAALDYGLGITPQSNGSSGTGYNEPAGYSSGQPTMQPNGAAGTNNGINYGSGWNGTGISAFRGGTATGTNYPAPNQSGGYGARPNAGPAGLSYGSLTAPFTMDNWQQLSPEYNFVRQQGTQGVLNQDTSGSGALSGSAMKDLINYNQSAAQQSFGNAFNMYQTQQGNIFNRLSSVAGMGQNAAANTGQQGTALAAQAAQSATNVGTAQAAGTVGQANAYSGAVSGASYLPWLYANSGGAALGGGGQEIGGSYPGAGQ